MSEANNVHPSEVGLATAVAEAGPVLSKKEQAKLANIIGFFRDAAEAVFPVQGFEVMTDPSVDVLRERLEALKPGTLVAQRARLESDPYFRHPIPYIVIFRQREDGSLEFFVYQRTKLIGEDLLGQKFSVALGGHPEAPSIRFHEDWSFNTTESLMACLVTELDEEATFNGMSFSDYSESGGMFTYGHEGFLRDDSDKVGLQHIGIVYTIGLPAGVEVECKEEELITVGFRTLEELSADLELPEVNAQYDFENWSKLVIRSNVERIEAAQAAAKVDAMFLEENGQAETVEADIGRGQTAPVQHLDEELYLGEEPDADQTWRQDQLEIAESGIAMCDPEDLPEIGEITDEHRSRHRAEGVALEDLVLPEGASLFARGELVFIQDTIEHPWEGPKELHAHVLPSDKDPIATLAQVKAGLLEQWMDPLNVEGMFRGEDGGLYFTIHPEDPNPSETIKFLTDTYKESVVGVHGIDTAEAPVDQFAKAIIGQLDAGPGFIEQPAVWQGTGNPIDPSAETKVLTELHREVGTTDDQMKVAVDELTRISDSVQPTAEEEATRLSDLAS
jgi:predicted NUDIX family phosphoesterase